MFDYINEIFQRKEIMYLIIYNILFLLGNLLGYFEIEQKIKLKNKYIFVLIFIFCYIIIGCFSTLGVDYYNYDFIVKNSIKKEMFYKFLTLISFKNVTLFYGYIIVLNILFLYILSKILKIKYYLFSISLFINFYFLDSINIIRSFQAQLIILIGIIFYLNKNKIKGYFFIIGSVFFHKTAIINFILILLKKVNKLTFTKLLIVSLTGILFNIFLLNIVTLIFKNSKYIVYIQNERNFNFSWWFLNINIIIQKGIFILYSLSRYNKKKEFFYEYRVLIKALRTGLLLYIGILFVNISPYIFQRVILFLSSFNSILFIKYLEIKRITKKEKIFYYLSSLILLVLNNIYVIRILYNRILVGK